MFTEHMSVEKLRDWLLTQPPEQEYMYQNRGECLLARYFKAMTGHDVLVEHAWVFDNKLCDREPLPSDLDDISRGSLLMFSQEKQTYASALERCNIHLDARETV